MLAKPTIVTVVTYILGVVTHLAISAVVVTAAFIAQRKVGSKEPALTLIG
jgi:hypothetical protein